MIIPDFLFAEVISDNVLGLFVFGFMVLIPIVYILVKHQQKMAELYRQPTQGPNPMALEQLSAEVRELRSLVTQQAIAVDNLAEAQRQVLARMQAPPMAYSQQVGAPIHVSREA